MTPNFLIIIILQKGTILQKRPDRGKQPGFASITSSCDFWVIPPWVCPNLSKQIFTCFHSNFLSFAPSLPPISVVCKIFNNGFVEFLLASNSAHHFPSTKPSVLLMKPSNTSCSLLPQFFSPTPIPSSPPAASLSPLKRSTAGLPFNKISQFQMKLSQKCLRKRQNFGLTWPRSGLYDANTLAWVEYVRKMVLTPFVNFSVTLAERMVKLNFYKNFQSF